MTSQSTIPAYYNTAFIFAKAGVTNHFGYNEGEEETVLRYRIEDYDAVQAALASYPVDYLSVMVPAMLEEVAARRDQIVQSFTFNGMPVALNDKTIANLTAATVGLERNAGVEAINWAISKEVFVSIPRAAMFAMADAAFNHVQNAFTAQMTIAQEIVAATDIEALRVIDIAGHAAWS